jgi:acyl carrier protein
MLSDDGIHQTICPDKSLSEQGLDSFRHLKMYVELERHFKIQLTENLFAGEALTNVSGLANLIRELLPQPQMG